jgi:O-antigen/teichoic acid export membrane protein
LADGKVKQPERVAQPVRLAKALLGFAGGLGVSAGVGFLSTPLVVIALGAHEWAGLAVGFSVGSLLAIFVSFGWGAIGPTTVALLNEDERGQYFADSVSTRFYLLIAALIVVAPIMWLVTPVGVASLAPTLYATTPLIMAMGAPWFFVGTQQAGRLFLLDTMPNALGTLLGALALLAYPAAWVFAGINVLGAMISVILTYRSVLSRHGGQLNFSARPAVRRLRTGASAVMVVACSSAYTIAPLLLVSATSPASGTTLFAAADRIQKYASKFLGVFTQVAQGYVPSGGNSDEIARRARISILLSVLIATFAGVTFCTLLPFVAGIYTAGKVDIGFTLASAFACTLAAVLVSGVVGLACLTAIGRVDLVAKSTLFGSLLGVPVLIACSRHGETWVAWGVAAVEWSIVLFQLIAFASVQVSCEEPVHE